MTSNQRHRLCWAFLLATCTTSAWGSDAAALRAYPDPVPEDASFDTVVKSQSFPFMKYPVNVLGTKVHPEEFHLTSSGEIILPYTNDWKGLCVAALIGSRRNEGGAGKIELALPPADLIAAIVPARSLAGKSGRVTSARPAVATIDTISKSATGS